MKLNARGCVESLRQRLDVLARTFLNWRRALNDDSSRSPWAPQVSHAERSQKINDEMAAGYVMTSL
jgi:hypothetical protein